MNPRLVIALAAAALLHGIAILLLMPARSAAPEEQLPPGEGQGFEMGDAATGGESEPRSDASGGVLELSLDEGTAVAEPPPAKSAHVEVPRGSLGGGKSYLGLVRAHLNAQRRALADAPSRPSVARVRFRISGEGATSEVMLAESSGLSLLDQEALALVSRASPLPPPPNGQALRVVVPVEFR